MQKAAARAAFSWTIDSTRVNIGANRAASTFPEANMWNKCISVIALVAALTWIVRAQDAASVIGRASAAIGADRLRTVQYSATGFDFALGQAYNPSAAWPKFIDKSYTRAIDFQVPASRVERVRLQGENPPRGGGQQPIRGEQPQTQIIVVGANTPWVQQLEIWMMPHGFLRAAAANKASVTAQTLNGRRYNVVSFTGQNNAQVNGYINDQDLIERVETRIDNAALGDMLFEAVYSDYKDFGGVKFPTRMVQRQGGYPILDLTISDVQPNAPVTIQAPQGRGGAPAGAAGGAQTGGTPSEKLADGVYLILGGYASVAVDFKDYIVVIEGPQSEERANAIITEAKRLIPNKPIRYVVNTHHHFDHSSGLRAFVAEGATVVTHQVNRPYYEKLFSAPHTLNPDRLAQSPRKPAFETMTEKKVLTDGNRVVELHHLQGSGHNEGLIVAYLPKERILIEADAYNPPADLNAPMPAPPSPYTMNLMANIERLKLDPERIIAVHYPADGRIVTTAELRKAIGQRTPSSR
jgi:glyoxylase-like metal-dependent hydrolase (beta-lactamase superfamily II)